MSQHLQNLRAALPEREIDALLISTPANRRYISGFSGSSGSVLVSAEAALLFTDFRYRTQVVRECPGFTLREISPEAPLSRLLADAAVELGIRRIGFEASSMTVAEYNRLAPVLNDPAKANGVALSLVPIDGVVEHLRETKGVAELETLRHAVAITDAAFSAVVPTLRPDHTEKQAAWMLEVAMRERGADGVAFTIIVAAGPNAALPHARPTDAPLGVGRPIVIDMGALFRAYHADLTRTIVLGDADEQFWTIYDLVFAAQQRALSSLRAGITGAQADALARDFLTEAGYGAYFGHGLGHGVGLNIHEEPSLRRAAPTADDGPPLRAGAVFSVEPGIYLEGWGGVRIEDLVLLHEDKCEVLSKAPKLRPA